MATRVGINGFGRIGRQSLKALIERAPDVEVVALNDLVDAEMNALLFKRDSTYGTYPGDVRAGDSSIIIDGREIKILAERDPAALPWGDLGVDIVLESTGLFTDAAKAQAHIDAGAKKVIISAPAKGEDITIVLGVNEDRYDPTAHHIISNASCTTNCLAPAAKVVHDLVDHRARADEHDPQLHERPAHPGRRAQGPAPRPERRPEHHPDDDRRRQGARARHPGPQGQVRRLQPARPDPDRQRRRLHRRRSAGRPRSRS